MSFIYSLRDRNILSGIIIFGLISFISYLISFGLDFYFFGHAYIARGIIYYGDIHFLIGVIVATIFSLNNMKPHQHSLKIGLIVGMTGSVLSAFIIALLEWVSYSFTNGIYFIVLLYILWEFFLTAFIIGILIGLLAGVYYMVKRKGIEESIDDEFLKDLIDD